MGSESLKFVKELRDRVKVMDIVLTICGK